MSFCLLVDKTSILQGGALASVHWLEPQCPRCTKVLVSSESLVFQRISGALMADVDGRRNLHTTQHHASACRFEYVQRCIREAQTTFV